MPVRRRVASVRERQADPEAIFRCSLTGDFTDVWFDTTAGFPSKAAAARAWPQYRRTIWASTHRLMLPRPARVFDGLTFDSIDRLCWQFGHITFDLDDVLAALAVDRANLAQFSATQGARAIVDFLEILREDFARVEAIARAWNASAAPTWQREYPRKGIGTYGSGVAAEGVN